MPILFVTSHALPIYNLTLWVALDIENSSQSPKSKEHCGKINRKNYNYDTLDLKLRIVLIWSH